MRLAAGEEDGVAVMGRHEDGMVSFGEDIEEAPQRVLRHRA